MKYALFGAGQLGQRYHELIKDKYDVTCFIDNDSKKQGGIVQSLAVMGPREAKTAGLKVILTMSEKFHLEIINQLYEIGIKEFYIPKDRNSTEIAHVDISDYANISEEANKICVLRNEGAGIASTALAKYNPYDDIKIVIVSSARKDANYYYQLLTSSLIITHIFEEMPVHKKTIELWHGFTIKTVGYMSTEKGDISGSNVSRERYSKKQIVCSLSKLYSILMGYCFKINYNKFHITGYPRNDMLFRSDGKKMLETVLGDIKQKNVVFYAPTYRVARSSLSRNGEDVSIFKMRDYDNLRFDKFLEENDILFIYKMHVQQAGAEAVKETDNIRRITDDMLNALDIDLYEILNGMDCLISDYSSVIIDYLLTDKPMIFTPMDLEEYSRSRGLMLEPYDAWMPGDIALNYEQLEKAIIDTLFGEDRHKKDRERLKRITHKCIDGNSTERVLELAREMLGIDYLHKG